MLTPETLALFNSALGIITVLSTVGVGLQTVIARRIAAEERIAGSRDFIIASAVIP